MYNDSGVTTAYADRENDIKILYDYDSLGRFSKTVTQDRNKGTFIGSAEFGYDVRNNLTNLVTNYGGNYTEQRYYYSKVDENSNSESYAKDNLPTLYKLYESRYAIYSYDEINRLTKRKFTTDAPLYYNYTYKSSERNTGTTTKYTTSQIQDEYIGDDVYTYTYGIRGNITGITRGKRADLGSATATINADSQSAYRSYKYDDLGQLTEEVNPTNNTKTTWTYDALGNITSRKEYVNGKLNKTVTYDYGLDTNTGWNNILRAVDFDGYDGYTENEEEIYYDKIGNPKIYFGATLSWNGRQLTKYIKDDTTITYKYDADGLRASKTVNGVKSYYFYVNGQLHYEKRGDKKLYFYYDSNGYLTGIEYDGTNYYPATNRRGDVVAIYDRFGSCVAKYEYDAWGNVLAITDASGDAITDNNHIAHINPIRYRGYYYDSETKLYYLQSRYYDPAIGRFINADVQLNDDILGNNTFAYCGNNPVSRKDNTGTVWWVAASAVIGAVVGAASRVTSNLLTGKKWYNGVVGSTIAGAVGGAIATTGHLATASYVSVALETTINEAISYSEYSWLSGSKQKTLTQNNIKNSCVTVVKDAAIKGFFAYVTGNIFGGSNATFDISPATSVSWGSVDVIVSALESVEVGLASIGQDYTGEFMSQKLGQIPKIQLYPETYVDESEER